MDGWLDGWMDGWMDGWVYGWMYGWMDGCMDIKHALGKVRGTTHHIQMYAIDTECIAKLDYAIVD
jgi:hypothetical protein